MTRGSLSALAEALCATAAISAPLASQERPIPYPVTYSHAYERAVRQGTRSLTGAPGAGYWQQWSEYTINARLDVDERRVEGTTRIVYHNRSPRPLPMVALQLTQNHHREGAARNRPAEITRGIAITDVAVDGQAMGNFEGGDPNGYRVMGTSMTVRLPRALQAGGSVTLDITWALEIPQHGASGRMGWSQDNLFYLAYWYPQMAVFEDVVGWQTDEFLGNAEFYMGYGRYDVTLDVPEGWVVMGTGRLMNTTDVFPETILERLRRAERSDTVVHVMTPADFGPGAATRGSGTRRLAWHFLADTVRDVAYSVTRASRWDAVRTPVGDRDGDGQTDYTRVDAIWRESAPLWANAWRYGQHSIDFLSRWTGLPYPWPHMTAVEGGGIIGGGMEYPMMTLIGDYNGAPDTSLYGVTVHELAHMWVPMIVGTDERRRAWMDEGTTSFNTSAGEDEFYPGRRWEMENYGEYLQIAGSDQEGELMRFSDYHSTPFAYGVASYAKPATLLWTLRGLLGSEVFRDCYQTYLREWAYKHPTPWDFFNTFNRVSGQDLWWFWRTWYFETWTLDHAIKEVQLTPDGTRVVVEDLGLAPMPVRLTLTTADGRTLRREISVDAWLSGARQAEVVVRTALPVVKVEIDAEQVFPDTDRRNNLWERR